MSLDNKLSILIQQQFPNFIKEDYPLFISFIELYYEWMEQEGYATDANKNLLTYQDIDTTLERFVLEFQKEFLGNLPSEILANKQLLVKHIREFYLARGSEKSYKFIFNILFNTTTDFYYPNRDILRLSDGKWIQNTSLRVFPIEGNLYDLIGRQIVQTSTNALATVENVQEFYIAGKHCFELFLNRLSVFGSFTPAETIKCVDSNFNIKAQIYPIVSHIFITNGGSLYNVNDTVSVGPDPGNTGGGLQAKVSSVDPNNNNAILSVEILNHGVNYSQPPVITFPNVNSGLNASGYCTLGAVLNYRGYYSNDDGQTDSTKHIQDGYYYQQFSYVTILNRSINEYKDIILRVLHPAGLKLFGEVRLVSHDPSKIQIPGRLNGTQATWVHIVREQFRNPNLSIDQPYPLNMKSNIVGLRHLIPTISQNNTSFKLGPSYRSLEREKFWHKPSSNFVTEETMYAPNTNYWSQYANYQIQQFEDIIIGDVEDAPWTKINIVPEPILITTQHL